jgi:hypothetical protein
LIKERDIPDMKKFARFRTALWAVSAGSALATLGGCGGSGSNGVDASEVKADVGACVVDLPPGLDPAAVDDPFFARVLRDGEACPTNINAVLDRLDATGASQTFVVSDTLDRPDANTSYRFVVAHGAQPDAQHELFVSTIGRARGMGGLIEAMGFSPSRQAYNFYELDRGQWHLVGNGADVVPGEAPPFACANCHESGAPLMKELQDSWANWNSTWFGVPDPNSQDPAFNRLFSNVQIADFLEPLIIKGTQLHVAAQVKREREAGRLQGLMKRVMCDVGEGNLIASHTAHAQRFGAIDLQFNVLFPGSFFVNQLFDQPSTGTGRENGYQRLIGMSLPQLGNVAFAVSGPSYAKAVNASGSNFGGELGDTMFPYTYPQRGFSDNVAVEELIAQGVLDKELAADLLMTDFTVPVFSKERCDLATTAPAAAASPDELRTAWAAALATSTLPGAADLKARLETPNDFEGHQAKLDAYVGACNARAVNEPDAFAADVVKLGSQRRKEFLDEHPAVVESDFLLPADDLTDAASHTWRLSPTTCNLVLQSEVEPTPTPTPTPPAGAP